MKIQKPFLIALLTILLVVIFSFLGFLIDRYHAASDPSFFSRLHNPARIMQKKTDSGGSVSVPRKNERQTLQLYRSEKYGFQFKYASNLTITPISNNEKIVLAADPQGHWEETISIEKNSKNLPLDQLPSLLSAQAQDLSPQDITITEMLVGNTYAKKYLLKNIHDYGNTIVVLIHGENVISIYGNVGKELTTTHLDLILQSFSFDDTRDLNLYNEGPYYKKNGKIYYIEQFNILNPLEDLDVSTFEKIGPCASVEMSSAFYSKDKKHVYINGDIAKEIDSKTFRYFGSFGEQDSIPRGVSIAKDKNHIYYGCGKIIDSIRKESFKVLGDGYAKDSKNIYYIDSILKVADYNSFSTLGFHKIGLFSGPFSIDKNNVYYQGQVINGITSDICRKKGIEACLPENWHDMLESSDYSLSPISP